MDRRVDADEAVGEGTKRRHRLPSGPTLLAGGSAVVWLVIAMVYACGLPLGAGPDEEHHLAYVDALAEHKALPVLPGTAAGAGGAPEVEQAQHPPLYYLVLAPVRALASSAVVLRLASLLLGAAALPVVWLAGRRLWPEDAWQAAVVVALFALLPQTQFMTAVINNSTGSMLAGAVVTLLCWRLVTRDECEPRDWMWVGLAVGMGLLTKMTAVWAVVMVLFCAVAHTRNSKAARAKKLACWTGLVLTAAAIVGPWLGSNKARHGAFIPERVMTRRVNDGGLIGMIAFPRDTLWVGWYCAEGLLPTYLAPYWLVRPQLNIYKGVPIALAASLPVLAGLAFSGVRHLCRPKAVHPEPRRLLFAAIGAGLVFDALMLLYMCMQDMNVLACQGRYMWEMSGALSLLAAHGLLSLRPARLRAPLTALTLGALALMSVLMCQYAVRFFAEHPPEL